MVGALAAFGPLSIDLYLPALPAICVELDSQQSAVQASLTACPVGLAVAQIAIGPVSGRVGRRRPLFVGLALYVAASVACDFAPNIVALIVLRFVQGCGGATGIVIGRAVVRDLHEGADAARFFSIRTLISGLASILGPQAGAALLHMGSWRLTFVALSVAGTVILGVMVFLLPETWLRATGRTLGCVRRFASCAN